MSFVTAHFWPLCRGCLLTCLFLIFALPARAQTHRLTLDDPDFYNATAVQEMPDGCTLLSGQCRGPRVPGGFFNATQAFVTKLDSAYNPVWTRRFGGRERTRINVMTQLINGLYVCAGFNEDSSNTENYFGYIAYLTQAGNLAFAINTGSGSPIMDVKAFEMDSLITSTVAQPVFNKGFFFYSRSRHMINGSMVDNKIARPGSFMGAAFGNSSILLSNNEALGTGWQNHPVFQNERGLMVTRIAPNGNVIWSNNFANSGTERGIALAEMPDSSFLVLGTNPQAELIMMKLDWNGNEVWTKFVNLPYPLAHAEALVEPNGAIVLAGNFASPNEGFLTKINDSLQVDWAYTFQDSAYGNLEIGDLKASSEGGWLLAGRVCPISGGFNDCHPLLIKTDSAGRISCLQDTLSLSLTDSSWALKNIAPANTVSSVVNQPPVQSDSLMGPITLGECGITSCLAEATFTSPQTSYCNSDTLVLQATGANQDSVIWRLNGQIIGAQPSLQIPISQIGSGSLTLTAYQGNCVATESSFINLLPDPVASFLTTPNLLSVAFNDQSSGNPQGRFWDFGDGNTSTQVNPSHTYASPGSYTVCLVTSNSCGSDTSCQVLTVVCPLPNPGFNTSSNLLSANFTNSTQGANAFLWDFGDGNTSSQISPTHTYANPGTYTVCLISSNNCGNDTLCQALTVTCPFPTGGFSSTANLLSAVFTNSSSGANSYTWDFGDGNTSSQTNPAHTYANPGTYTVCLISSNSCGSDTLCQPLTVTCPLPAGGFSSTANLLSVSFSNTSTGANNYSWDFGDGNTSTLQNPVHSYANAGSYTVCLIGINSCGQDTFCQTLTVSCPLPQAAFSFTAVNRDLSFTNLSNGGTSWLWDFGDGNTSTLQNPTHSYAQDGSYWVCLSLSDSCGSDTLCDSVTVLLVGRDLSQNQERVQVWPNPSKDVVNIRIPFKGGQTNFSFELFDLRGRFLLRKEGQSNRDLQVSTSHLSEGVYLYKIRQQDGFTHRGKLRVD